MGVFATNAKDEVYYRVGTNANPATIGTEWQKLTGVIRQISVGTNNVWGVNAGDKVFTMENIKFVNSKIEFNWNEVPGSLKQIATISSPPLMDCKTHGFCMIRAPRPAKWGSAKTFCASHNMVLPHPINKYENRMLAVAGSTWLDVNVNDIFNEDNKNFNNWVRRQRGWMNSNGVWSALLADSVQNYFCVKPGMLTMLFNSTTKYFTRRNVRQSIWRCYVCKWNVA